jgi:ATP-dependent Lon protease
LREELKAIHKELGEKEEDIVTEYSQRINLVHMPEEAKKEARRELEKIAAMTPQSAEYSMIKTYLDWLIELPWQKTSTDELDIDHARSVLDTDHYDIYEVKDRILEYLAVKKILSERNIHKEPDWREMATILCFVGPPGVGKTSLGQSIARALGRQFTRMSLGGIRDEAEIRGHRRTYIGALPGRIIQAIKRVGTRNPVFMLDEIDKVGADWRGDPSSALLEVLDPAQNHSFRDNYLDVEFDLSEVMFITTANQLETILPPLLDRMEIITLDGYTEYEKLLIALKYLIPRQLKENGLRENEITFTDSSIQKIIEDYTHEAGVRNLERQIGAVCRKCVIQIASGRKSQLTITPEMVRIYLKKEKFESEISETIDIPGIVTGLAVTDSGGEILFIEATYMKGKGELIITGQLGAVMRESAQIAHSYVRSKANQLTIDPDEFGKTDLHLHVPAGATPKDGPSAGLAMVLAIASLFSNKPVPNDIGMTGEATLRGRVLPVGGIKMKLLAAHRAGLKTVLLPKRNEKDLEELPDEVRKAIRFVFVERIDDALRAAFLT